MLARKPCKPKVSHYTVNTKHDHHSHTNCVHHTVCVAGSVVIVSFPSHTAAASIVAGAQVHESGHAAHDRRALPQVRHETRAEVHEPHTTKLHVTLRFTIAILDVCVCVSLWLHDQHANRSDSQESYLDLHGHRHAHTAPPTCARYTQHINAPSTYFRRISVLM